MDYDVIVVGAGPAGSTTSRECATRGLSVLLLDKAEFPRDKPCGGAVNVRAANLLPFSLAPVTERTILRLRIGIRGGPSIERGAHGPFTHLTQRRHLDTFLAERAVAAGVTFRQRAAVRALEQSPRGAVVRAGSESFRARVVVAADGASGITARLAGIAQPHEHGVALEADVRGPRALFEARVSALSLDLGTVPGGFGWVFPKGDHVNVGVGGWLHVAAMLRPRLTAFARANGLDPGAFGRVRGHRLPVRTARWPIVKGRVLLVGDAAGLVEPLTGEGIFGAIWSGRAAAAAIADHLSGECPGLEHYEESVNRFFLPETEIGVRLHDALHLWPGASRLALAHVDELWRFGFRWLRGEDTLQGFRVEFTRLWLALYGLSIVGRRVRGLRELAHAAARRLDLRRSLRSRTIRGSGAACADRQDM